MTEREKTFFDRKLQSTTGEEHDKVVRTAINHCIADAIEKYAENIKKEKERNEKREAAHVKISFGL